MMAQHYNKACRLITPYEHEDLMALVICCELSASIDYIDNEHDVEPYIQNWFYYRDSNPLDDIHAYASFNRLTFIQALKRITLEALNTSIYNNTQEPLKTRCEDIVILSPIYVHYEEHKDWLREYRDDTLVYAMSYMSHSEFVEFKARLDDTFGKMYSSKDGISRQIFVRNFLHFCSEYNK